jgi:hypothetical protein
MGHGGQCGFHSGRRVSVFYLSGRPILLPNPKDSAARMAALAADRRGSAGADGVCGTEDDVIFVTRAQDADNWEQLVNGLYVRRVEGEYVSFIHRVEHGKFRWANSSRAHKATGTDMFDMFRFVELFGGRAAEEEPHSVLVQLGTHPDYDRPGEQTEPLFFVNVRDVDDG